MLLLFLSFASYLSSLFKRPFIYAGFVFQVIYIISRGLELDRLPLVGPHDTIAFLSASIVAFYVPFSISLRGRLQPFHNIVAVMASVFTAIALLSRQHNSPLPPVLKTFWFETHVVAAFLSYALLGIAAVLGYLYINKEDNSNGERELFYH